MCPTSSGCFSSPLLYRFREGARRSTFPGFSPFNCLLKKYMFLLSPVVLYNVKTPPPREKRHPFLSPCFSSACVNFTKFSIGENIYIDASDTGCHSTIEKPFGTLDISLVRHLRCTKNICDFFFRRDSRFGFRDDTRHIGVDSLHI
jgi:hypothetical protein